MKKTSNNSCFVPTYAKAGAPMVKGKGVYLFDIKGKAYLDFGSGIAVTALGHSHPDIVSTLKNQGKSLLHVSNLYHEKSQIEFAKSLVKHSFGDRVFLCNSGTEANEAAIKFARKWAGAIDPKKYHILSFSNGFHGRTYGALSATAQKKLHNGFKPIISGFHYTKFNDIEAAKKTLKKFKFAAILIEPLQGESGINTADTQFLIFLRKYATKHNIALVFDEVQCGVGRTGTMWHYEQHNVIPDIMTVAKPVGGGLPLGAAVCKNEIAMAMTPGDHGSTFGGNPLACALGCVVLNTISKKSFLKKVRTNGDYLKKSLTQIVDNCGRCKDILGVGLMVGVRFKEDPGEIIASCRKNGLLVVKAANNTVRFMPPLIVTKEEIDRAINIFRAVL